MPRRDSFHRGPTRTVPTKDVSMSTLIFYVVVVLLFGELPNPEIQAGIEALRRSRRDLPGR
jgi:hypothetical protein